MTQRTRLLRLFLVVALAADLSAVSEPSYATKPLPPAPEAISASPEVKFLEPAARTTLSGAVPFRIGAGAVDQIVGWQFGSRSAGLTSTPYPMGSFHYNTLQLTNGPHTFVARATYKSGAVAEATLKVIVYNPAHQLTNINAVTYEPLDGKDAIVELTYARPGLKVEVDLSELDSNFDAKKVNVNEVRPGVYRISYRISSTNTVPPGRHQVHVRAINAKGEVVPSSFEWQLRKHPLIPVSIRGCQFSGTQAHPIFSYETYHSVPEVTIDPKVAGVPKNVRLSGAAELEVDSPATAVRVAWTAPAQNTKSLPAAVDARLLVTADGYTGYYLCWVPQGGTSATLTLDMKRPGYGSNLVHGEPVPNQVRLKVAVERAGYAEAWREHAFKIRLPGASATAATTTSAPKKKKKVRVP